MTATSLRNTLPMRNAWRVVNDNMKMTIVNCILYMLGIPLAVGSFMIGQILESRNNELHHIFRSNWEVYTVIGCICVGAAIFMGLFVAINAFTEMFKKTRVDMLYALPLTGRQRFFSDYFGGCLMYVIPYIITVLIGWLEILCLMPFINWGQGDAVFDTVQEFTSEFCKYYGLFTLGLLFLMLLYFTMTVFLTVCCGTLFEALYTNVLLNCLIPGTLALIIALVTDDISLEFEYAWHIIGFISPIGGLIYMIYLISGEGSIVSYSGAYNFFATQTNSHEMLPNYFRWILIILLVTAALLFGAWQLYTRRKAEDAGKPFVYIVAYYIMLTLVTISILCIMRAKVYGPVILAAAIVYFIMEVIRKRGFKRFWLSIVTFIATVALSIGGYMVIVKTGCFGRVNYVPAAIGVNSVVVEYNMHDDIGGASITLEYTDRDVISQVTALHREIVNTRKLTGNKDYNLPLNREMLEARYARLLYNGISSDNYDTPVYSYDVPVVSSTDYSALKDRNLLDPSVPLPDGCTADYVDTGYLDLTYYTLTGSVIHRSYSATPDEMQKLLDIVQGTELYAQAVSTGLRERLDSRFSEYDTELHIRTVPNNIRLQMTAVPRENSANVHSVYIKNAAQKFDQLTQAYRADLAAMNAEDFRTAKTFGYISEMPVYENCTQTVALLKNWGLTAFNTAERIGYADVTANDGAVYSTVGIALFRPDSFRTASTDYQHSSVSTNYVLADKAAYMDMLFFSNSDDLEKLSPELYALLSAARTQYVTDENCYLLNFDGKNYIIPEKDAALAEAVIEMGTQRNSWEKQWQTSADSYEYFSDEDEDYGDYFDGNSAPNDIISS